MSHQSRHNSFVRSVGLLERLEARQLFAAAPPVYGPIAPSALSAWVAGLNAGKSKPAAAPITPGSVLTKANRQTLLDGLNVASGTKTSLQGRLTANDLAGFDQQLLNYMTSRGNAKFYWDLSDTAGLGTYINSNIGDSGDIAAANQILAHLFPAQSNSTTYDVNVGATINWTSGAASTNAEFLHTLNRQGYWGELSSAYRYTGNAAYANELINQLASWSAAYPTMATPVSWSAVDQKAWLLDMGVRVTQWCWSYSQLLGSAAWTKEANTLLLFKMQQQLGFLSTATSYGVADNRTVAHAKGWLFASELFPEFTVTSATPARQLLFAALDGQFYNDGSHHEQSPGYAGGVIGDLLEAKQLDARNGYAWPSAQNTKLSNAIESYFQFLTPDGNRPAFGDTYRNSAATLFLSADLVQNVTAWPAAKPRGRDVWIFGIAATSPYSGNANYPLPGDRGTSYAMPDGGNYIFRSPDAGIDTRQILFHAGPRGGTHGHFDQLNFELFGYGKALISDPGLVNYSGTDPNRLWAVSTPAHNTISADNLSTGTLNDIGTGSPGVVVDQWDDQSDHVQVTAHHFGYNYFTGKPVLSRSIWYDKDGTMLIVDTAEGLASHTYTTSFLVPGQNKSFDLNTGLFKTTNPTGGNVKIQPLAHTGQTYTRTSKFVSNTIDDGLPSAQRWAAVQTGNTAVFATLITAYNGTSEPNITANWITSNPQPGQPIQLQLVKNGTPQTITFNPPGIERLAANGQNSGSYCDIAYDKSGNLHMAWYDRRVKHLKYAMRNTAGKWSAAEIVDNGYQCGFNPSIAIDSKGHVGIAYTNGNYADLKYAYFNGTEWSVETIDSRGSVGHEPSLAFSRKDGPVISYYDKTHGDLMLATSGATWLIQRIDTGSTGARDAGHFSHLVLDPARPEASKWAIGYEDTSAGTTKYAIQGKLNGGSYNAGTGFSTFVADNTAGGYVSLAFDSANRPSLSHYDSYNGDLRLARSAGSTLIGGISFTASAISTRGNVGAYSALYFDSVGKLTILFLDKSKLKLMKARLTTAWSYYTLAAGGFEIHASKYGTGVAYTNVDSTYTRVMFM